MAFYVTASAAVAAIGGRMLRRGTLLIIHGTNDGALQYGKGEIHKQQRSVVFMDEGCDSRQEAAVYAMGAVVEKMAPDQAFLRRMGIGASRRRIEIAALHEDAARNIAFARELLKALKGAGVSPEQTSLMIRGMEEAHASSLMNGTERYGYGSVFSFDEYDLAARLMIKKAPPCETIEFDGDAKAKQDFSALMIGFGRMGRAALEQLVMNGQFVGSAFRVDIFDRDAQNGMLHDHEMMKHYDIRFHAASGKADALYAFLTERYQTLRYIVICTGSEKENRELAQDVGRWLKEHGVSPTVVQCTAAGIAYTRPMENEEERLSIFDGDVLDVESMDRMAMVINQMYCGNSGGTARENWMRCDYFGKMSSRASADFYPAMLYASGKTGEQVMRGDWPPHAGALENLAVTEHMRWCAFHYVMGFHPMPDEEFDLRAAQYLEQVRQTGASSLRIEKNMKERRHACLIDWEELDKLSQKENAVTGKQIDYKRMDRSNILALPQILRTLNG